MLPFHLRPPRYGGKLKKKITSGASLLERQHPLRDGGPVQRAMKEDLLAIYQKFEDSIHALSTQEEKHHADGAGFACFGQVFSSAKVALLHTRLAAPRCDSAAHTQLIYATCFSMLKDVFQEEEKSFHLNRAGFALFLLYTLFETCPLPPAPTTTREQIDTLPMTLTDRDNVRLMYRRSYREPIRIDQEQFSYIIRLRHLASAATAQCQQSLCKCQQQAAEAESSLSVPPNASKIKWTCQCAISRDITEVVLRLLPNLHFCSYTGPCCLEGLAGHADYSYPANTNSYAWLHRIRKEKEEARSEEDNVLNLEVPSEIEPVASTTEYSQELLGQLKNYLADRNAIRLPPANGKATNRVKRFRKALLPIFSSADDAVDPLEVLQANRVVIEETHTVRQRTVQFQSGDDEEEKEEGGLDHEMHEEAGALDIELPSDLSPALKESVEAAFETLSKRAPLLQLPPELPPPPLETAIANGNTGGEEISTLGDTRGASTIPSVSIGIGGSGHAMRDLLSRAVSTVHDTDKLPLKETDGAAQKLDDQNRGLDRSLRFLQSDSVDGDKEQPEDFSDISSDEGHGLPSVTNSTVGKTALRDLIAAAKNSGRKRSSRRTRASVSDHDSLSARCSTEGRAALGNLLALASDSRKDTAGEVAPSRSNRKNPGKKKASNTKRRDRTGIKQSQQQSVSDEQSHISATSSTRGRSALQVLLSTATAESPPLQNRHPKTLTSKSSPDGEAAISPKRKMNHGPLCSNETKRARRRTKDYVADVDSMDRPRDVHSPRSLSSSSISSSTSSAESSDEEGRGQSALDTLLSQALA